MPRGGKRDGAGRKKGQQTLEKEAARELVRQQVFAELGPLVASQIANAKGLKFLVVRQKSTGKFLRVTEAVAKMRSGQELKEDEEIIEVWEKDPSVQAFTDLLNRALDKPKEQEQDINVRGQVDVIGVLRQRHARAKSLDKMAPSHGTDTDAGAR